MGFPDLRALREFYGLLPQPPSDPFQFFLWEILSADALPARRDLAWQALRRIPALTPDSVFRARSKDLLEAIGIAGPRREERLEQIRAITGEFKRQRDLFESEAFTRMGLRKAARATRRLTELPRESADRALLYVGGYCVLPLDDGAARVVIRVDGAAIPISEGAEGLTLKRARRAVEWRLQRRHARSALTRALRRHVDIYKEAVVYLRHHAHHTCTAVAPHCTVCPLAPSCAFALARSRA